MPETVLTQTPDNQPKPDAPAPDAPKPDATPAPDATPKPDAPAVPKWRAALPEELRGEKMFDNIKGDSWDEVGPTLAKGYAEAQKLVGNSMGKLPAKDAKPEEVEAWRKANLPKLREAGLIDGPPADPSGYRVKPVKNGEPIEVDATSMYAFNKLAFDMGLTNAQAQMMLDAYFAEQTKMGGSVKDSIEALTKEYGEGAVWNQIRTAQQAARQVGGEELINLLEVTGLGNHPAMIKMFAKVGAILVEDDSVFADTVKTGVGEARAARDKLMKDKNSAYWNREDPGHKDAVAEVARLNQIIFAQEG